MAIYLVLWIHLRIITIYLTGVGCLKNYAIFAQEWTIVDLLWVICFLILMREGQIQEFT